MVWAKPIRVIDRETGQDYSILSNATLHTLVAILNTFRQLDKKCKSKKKRNYDRTHTAYSFPDLADDKPV